MIIAKSLRLFIALGLVTSGLVIAGTANSYAQISSMSVPTSAAVNQFMPIGSWSVQPTAITQVRGLSGVKLPCMMTANYDNGYVLRLSGGNHSLLAMAIDFRQNVFKQGRKYSAILRIDGGYTQKVSATAFTQNVLLFNLRKVPNFYSALQNAVDLRLEVEGNVMGFTVGGINHAFQRLEGCYSGEIQQANVPIQPMVTAASLPAPTAVKWGENVPSVYSRAPYVPQLNQRKDSVSSAASSTLWTANVGDDLRQVLEGWSARAGVKLDWQSDQASTVPHNFRLNGTFTEAVQNIMAQSATVIGLEANLQSSGSSVSVGAPQPLLPSRGGVASARHSSSGKMGSNGSHRGSKWSASAGSSLQQVLGAWAQEAGVEFVWAATQGFAVKRAVNGSGSYESALQSLLGQYTGDNVRPVVQLNKDPSTGRRILFVESTRVL